MKGLCRSLEVIVVFALCALSIMLIWNWLFPVLFGLPVINYWQALGFKILADSLSSEKIRE